MKQYDITNDLRVEVNGYLGEECLTQNDVGKVMYKLEICEVIGKVDPEKVKLLLATLFPEELSDPSYVYEHKEEIVRLANRFHVAPSLGHGAGSWNNFLVRREGMFDQGPIRYADGDLMRTGFVRIF